MKNLAAEATFGSTQEHVVMIELEVRAGQCREGGSSQHPTICYKLCLSIFELS